MGTDGRGVGGGAFNLCAERMRAGDVPARRRGSEIHSHERGEGWGERRGCGCESTWRETLALFARVGAGADANSRKRPKLACELSLAGGPILHQSGLAQRDMQPTKHCEYCRAGAMQMRGRQPNTPGAARVSPLALEEG